MLLKRAIFEYIDGIRLSYMSLFDSKAPGFETYAVLIGYLTLDRRARCSAYCSKIVDLTLSNIALPVRYNLLVDYFQASCL